MKHFLYFSCILFLFSCKKEEKNEVIPEPQPVSCWSAPTRKVNIYDVVNFKNCSQNFDRVEWNFGDTRSSTISEPSHAYISKGMYNVTLTVYKNNISHQYVNKISVGQKAEITMNAVFTDWNIDPKYSSYQLIGSIHRSNDLNTALQETGPYFGWPMNGSASAPITTKNAVAVFPDDYSDYRLKLEIYGKYNFGAGTDNLGTIITDDINIWTGPKTPVATVTLPVVKVNYSLSDVRFN